MPFVTESVASTSGTEGSLLSGLYYTASFGRGVCLGLSSARLQIPSHLPVSGAEPAISEARDKCSLKKCTQSIKWKGGGCFTRMVVQNPDSASASVGPVNDGRMAAGRSRSSLSLWCCKQKAGHPSSPQPPPGPSA